ncbi:DTW domain protein [Rubripirellula tenax]|uniref:tRNA-uridine aminocarboxypropyltransferase n=1 Tax=Rubripirellula tenax TaxID=2528015 RepID=A0A5C6EFR2_9BACT|nr:DTW domain protein [Rubripirellula tenax]
MPRVNNRTDVLILQHRREREHPFNTARIVDMALDRCRLMVDHNDALARRLGDITLAPDAALLYPTDEAPLLMELAPELRPSQLVVLDGTWHHTKTLMRDIPRLQQLRQVRLAPPKPGNYRIRREPNDHALSTLEAVIAALAENEPDTLGLSEQLSALMQAFNGMVDQQLQCPKSNWRANQRRTPGAANVPRLLLGDQSDVVVAYGEQQQGDYRSDAPPPPKGEPPRPVYWVAQRMVSGETFEMVIDNDCLHDAYFADRLQLSPSQIGSAVTLDQFRSHWQNFLHPTDTIVVPGPGTAKLLSANQLCDNTCLILKSINAPESPEIESTDPINPTRAAARLANAIAKTIRYGKS